MLNQVQKNNLLALAPVKTAAALGLCREIAALRSADAAKLAATPTGTGTPLIAGHQVTPSAIVSNSVIALHNCAMHNSSAFTTELQSGKGMSTRLMHVH